MGNTVYKLEYWNVKAADAVYTEGPYATKGAAQGRLTNRQNYAYSGKIEGRVLELTGEWVEVE